MDGIQEALMSGVAQSASPIIGIEKKCTRCGKIQAINEFKPDKKAKDKHSCYCRECFNEIQKNYYKKNPQKYREVSRIWTRVNPEKSRANSRKWRTLNPEKHREYNYFWRKNNPEKQKELCRRATIKRLGTPKGKINHRLATSIRRSLRGSKNGRHWEDLVGYAVEDLKKHLEKQFKDGMTWKKFMDREIHIDHVIPKSKFNFEKPEDDDFKRCWALENLRPLWAVDNMKKSNKLSRHFQPRLIF